MKYVKIEDAIVIENLETEPKFRVETIPCEIIPNRRSEFTLFGIFDEILNFFDPSHNQSEYIEPEQREKPENAVIVDQKEEKITEIKYCYIEVY